MPATAEAHDMKPIREVRSEGVESMQVIPETWQQQNHMAVPAPVEVVERDPVEFQKLIGRLTPCG